MPLSSYKVSELADDGWYQDDGCTQGVINTQNVVQLASPTTSPEIFRAYWRFQNVQIPQGAQIVNATFYAFFEENGNLTRNDSRYIMYGEDADNAAQVTGVANGPHLRTYTTANANPCPEPPYIPYGSPTGPAERVSFCDVTAIIQEIVDRPGWAPGNALMLILDDPFDCFTNPKSTVYMYGSMAVGAPWGNGNPGDEGAELDIEHVDGRGEFHQILGNDMM